VPDVEGALVGTKYQRPLRWCRAFREHGVVLPVGRLHRLESIDERRRQLDETPGGGLPPA
jgi:hypothetical protein